MSDLINQDVFVIENLMYFPMGAHVPVLNRPFIVNASEEALGVIHDRVSASKSANISSSIVGSVMGSLIQPSPVGEITPIDHSWVNTQRYVFLLKVKTIDALGVEINSYLQGYTQYDGINRGTGSIDQNLVHHINNVIETSIMTLQTPLGLIHKEKLYNVYNVFGSQTNDIYTQRPLDIIDNMSLMSTTAYLNDSGSNITSRSINNSINQFNNSVISSTIDNNIGTDYLCKIINAGLLNHASRSIYLDSYTVTEDSSSTSVTREPSIADNRFIRYISRKAGYMSVKDDFTFSQLADIDPTIYNRFTVIVPTKTYMDPMLLNTPEVGDHWVGQDPVTLKAYSLIESSVALAMKYGFNKLYFTVSNMTGPMMAANVFITNFKSFISLDDSDFSYLLEIFKSKFISDIFIGETFGGTVPLHAEVYIDLLGTTKILLEYGGFPANWYTIPTTANSLFSPVITADGNTLDAATIGFDQMINSLVGNAATNNYY